MQRLRRHSGGCKTKAAEYLVGYRVVVWILPFKGVLVDFLSYVYIFILLLC